MLEKTSRRNTKVKSTIKKVGKETVNFCKKPAKKSLIRVQKTALSNFMTRKNMLKVQKTNFCHEAVKLQEVFKLITILQSITTLLPFKKLKKSIRRVYKYCKGSIQNENKLNIRKEQNSKFN